MGSRIKLQQAIIAYLAKHPKKPIQVDDLEKVTGCTRTQVQAVMLRISQEPARGITVLNRGNVWRYDPPADPEAQKQAANGDLYESIGHTSSGATIVRDADGTLYVLKEIKV